MAIAPKDMYPSQIAVGDVNYPAGKAQNVVVVGDGVGTPWEKTIVNERFGFEQALLRAAGMTENGVPESVAASQYLAAIQALIAGATNPVSDRVGTLELVSRRPGFFNSANTDGHGGQFLSDGALVKWVEADDPAGAYSVTGSSNISVPRNGRYWVTPTLNFQAIASGAAVVGFYVRRDTLVAGKAADWFDANSGQTRCCVSARVLVKITDYTTQRINVQMATPEGTSGGISEGILAIEPAF